MEIHEECFASTKKGGRRKYVRKAYEKSKQLAQRSKLSPIKRNSIMELADMSGQLADKLRDTSTRDTTSYGDLQQMIVLLGRNVDMMMKELTGKSIKIAL
jgi:hypothetical protein